MQDILPGVVAVRLSHECRCCSTKRRVHLFRDTGRLDERSTAAAHCMSDAVDVDVCINGAAVYERGRGRKISSMPRLCVPA